MSPDDVKQLRKQLACTARELAVALNVEQKDVLAWEAGEAFPTKRFVTQMEALRQRGPSAIARAPRGKAPPLTGVQRLADAKLWELIRKLLAHPALFEQAQKLAENYADPAQDTPGPSGGKPTA